MTTSIPRTEQVASGQRDIRYLVPGPMHLTELGTKELARREAKLQSWALPGTNVSIKAVPAGPASIESMYEEYLAIPAMAKLSVEAQEDGADAVIIGCFGDPGIDGLREVTDILVTGPASASIAVATTLGHKFSFVTVTDSIVPALRRLAWDAGALDALASIRAINTSVMDINKDHDAAVTKMVEQGRKAIEEDGADALVLGCMSMGFLDVAEQMTQDLGVPVINPSRASLHVTEATLALGLTHSRQAFMTPPKLASGKSLDELYLTAEPS